MFKDAAPNGPIDIPAMANDLMGNLAEGKKNMLPNQVVDMAKGMRGEAVRRVNLVQEQFRQIGDKARIGQLASDISDPQQKEKFTTLLMKMKPVEQKTALYSVLANVAADQRLPLVEVAATLFQQPEDVRDAVLERAQNPDKADERRNKLNPQQRAVLDGYESKLTEQERGLIKQLIVLLQPIIEGSVEIPPTKQPQIKKILDQFAKNHLGVQGREYALSQLQTLGVELASAEQALDSNPPDYSKIRMKQGKPGDLALYQFAGFMEQAGLLLRMVMKDGELDGRQLLNKSISTFNRVHRVSLTRQPRIGLVTYKGKDKEEPKQIQVEDLSITAKDIDMLEPGHLARRMEKIARTLMDDERLPQAALPGEKRVILADDKASVKVTNVTDSDMRRIMLLLERDDTLVDPVGVVVEKRGEPPLPKSAEQAKQEKRPGTRLLDGKKELEAKEAEKKQIDDRLKDLRPDEEKAQRLKNRQKTMEENIVELKKSLDLLKKEQERRTAYHAQIEKVLKQLKDLPLDTVKVNDDGESIDIKLKEKFSPAAKQMMDVAVKTIQWQYEADSDGLKLTIKDLAPEFWEEKKIESFPAQFATAAEPKK